MGHKSNTKSKTKEKQEKKFARPMRRVGAAARVLAPEDIEPGIHVCLFSQRHELLWIGDCAASGEAVRQQVVSLLPRWPSVHRVQAVSLPFVLAVDADGEAMTFDVRLQSLALVDPKLGKAAFKQAKLQRARS